MRASGTGSRCHAPPARTTRAVGTGWGRASEKASRGWMRTVVGPPLAQQPPVRHPSPPPWIQWSLCPLVVLPGLPRPLKLVTTPRLNHLLGLFLRKAHENNRKRVLARGPGREAVPSGPAHLRISPPARLHTTVVCNHRFVHELDWLIIGDLRLPGHGVVDHGSPLGVGRVGPTRSDVRCVLGSVPLLPGRAHCKAFDSSD